jgi:ribosomal protein L11 methyltransferase
MSAWLSVSIELDRELVPLFTAGVLKHGAGGVEEQPADGETLRLTQPWEKASREAAPARCRVTAWVDPDVREALQATLSNDFNLSDLDFREAIEEDWEDMWKQHHHRIPISDTLTISPPWEAQPGDLIIPPGNAFGIGDHPTTRACLEAIDELTEGLSTCLDVGCGSGILALAAARNGLSAEGIDTDPISVRAAEENASTNSLTVRFSTNTLSHFKTPRDLIVANLFAEVLSEMAPELIRLTGQHLVLAGIMESKASSLMEIISPHLTLVSANTTDGWTCLRYRNDTKI